VNDREPIIEVAEQRLSERKNISDVLKELKAKPEVLKKQIAEFDQAIETLNSLLTAQEIPPMLKNITLIKEKVGEASFPIIKSLEESKDFGLFYAVHAAVEDVNRMMKAGEEGGEYKGEFMQFHQDVTDPEELAADCLIEGYGQFAQRLARFKGLKRAEFVLAFEEALGFKHPDFQLWKFVQPWISEEEGFSPEFVDFVKARA